MTTTVSDLIVDTQALLYGSQRRKLNRLTSDPGASSTTWNFDFTPAFRAESYLSCEDEIVYVWEVDEGAKTATVQRAQLGTTGAAHAASSLVEVNPLFPQVRIRRALQDDIRSWPDKLYQTATLDLTVGATDRAVDLTAIPSDFYRILRVLRSPVTGSDSWTEVQYRLERDLPTSEFASGSAIFIDDYPGTGGADLRVEFAKPFDVDTFTDVTTLASVGLSETMLDIPPYGAAWRLNSGRTVRRTRTDAQGEARAAAEVSPNDLMRTAEDFRRHRDIRIEEEARRLAGRDPLWSVL